MTTANKITLARIALLPFFVVFALINHPICQIVALALFCLASFTDFLDGYIARKYNQITDFGKFADPLADKLMVTAALVIFVEKGLMASWMVFIILAREFIITSLRNVAAAKGQVMAAAWTGKVKTCVQIAGVILIFLVVIYSGMTQWGGSFTLGQSVNVGASSIGVIGGADGPTAIFISGDPVRLICNLIGGIVTLVTIYSGYDYLKRNWSLVAEGATQPKQQ